MSSNLTKAQSWALHKVEEHRRELSGEQKRTLRGQIFAGQVEGAMAGLGTIIGRRQRLARKILKCLHRAEMKQEIARRQKIRK